MSHENEVVPFTSISPQRYNKLMKGSKHVVTVKSLRFARSLGLINLFVQF